MVYNNPVTYWVVSLVVWSPQDFCRCDVTVVCASACVLRNKMTCAMKLEYNVSEDRELLTWSSYSITSKVPSPAPPHHLMSQVTLLFGTN